jgi:ABC-type multidrug transport system fused ATPase/permease subunit
MNEENRNLKIDNGADEDLERADERAAAIDNARLRFWVNWVLAMLTVLAAAVVMVFALGAVMSTAACSDKQCPNLGPSGIGFGVLFYGAPVVAGLAVAVSFFTARRRWGIVVPVLALAFLIVDITIVAVTVAQ